MDRYTGLRQRAKRFWFIYIDSLDRTLTALFVSCLLVIIAHEAVFAGWPELFSGGAELWDLLYRLCFAFAASYIFYIVVVHIKRQRDKDNIRPFLTVKTVWICEDAKQLIRGLRGRDELKDDPDYHPSFEEIKTLCKHIRAHEPSPLYSKGERVPWIEFMRHLKDRSEQRITNIYAVSHLLDADYLKLLMAIEECKHFTFLEISGYTMGGYTSHPNLSFIAAHHIYDYIEKVRALEQYSERTFSG